MINVVLKNDLAEALATKTYPWDGYLDASEKIAGDLSLGTGQQIIAVNHGGANQQLGSHQGYFAIALGAKRVSTTQIAYSLMRNIAVESLSDYGYSNNIIELTADITYSANDTFELMNAIMGVLDSFDSDDPWNSGVSRSYSSYAFADTAVTLEHDQMLQLKWRFELLKETD